MAREDQSGDWAGRLSPSLDEVESIAIEALAHLPQEFRALCGDIIIQIADFPEEQIVEDMASKRLSIFLACLKVWELASVSAFKPATLPTASRFFVVQFSTTGQRMKKHLATSSPMSSSMKSATILAFLMMIWKLWKRMLIRATHWRCVAQICHF